MKTLFEESQSLPEGLWLVKWVDYFSLGRGFISSPRVHVVLQKIQHRDVATLERLSQQDVGYLVGRRPGQSPDEVASWAIRPVLTGMLPLLRIGDVVRGHRIEGALRQRETTISLTGDTPVRMVGIFDEQPAPQEWSGKHYRVLNRFEYELGAQPEVRGAKCLSVKIGKAEYLIPATVILKTFYGFHTKLANAICSGPWATKFHDVISTMKYESGLGTYVDPQTGAWNIVVQAGLTRAHAVRLAVLHFDDYARSCANAIYASALDQSRMKRADDERMWFANAKIPYRWDEQPLQLRVKGFPLRAHRPSTADGMRFLVTRIDATSWPFPDQEINSELANSNALSPERNPQKVRQTYFKPKPPPVQASLDAELTHNSDAYVHSADNKVDADDFKFLNSPRHGLQVKQTHKEYLGPAEPPSEPPSPLLSAGNQAPGSEKPAPLVADSRDRRPSHQLQFLLNTLDALLEAGQISSFDPVGPPESSHLRQIRNGVPCWSFLSEEQARRIGSQARGWEFIFETARDDSGRRRAFARCLLVVRVQIEGHELLLFEVEPRATDSGYCTYVCEPTEPVSLTSIETALLVIRSYGGRLPKDRLRDAFRGLSSRQPRALVHDYERDESTNRATGLNAEALRRGLLRACGQADSEQPAATGG